MTWIKLKNYTESSLFRGSLLKFPAKYPFEDAVVMMISELRFRESDCPYGLVTVTGYKAGINPFVAFPKECLLSETSQGLSTKWVVENWLKWIYPDCSVDDVWVKERFDVSEIAP